MSEKVYETAQRLHDEKTIRSYQQIMMMQAIIICLLLTCFAGKFYRDVIDKKIDESPAAQSIQESPTSSTKDLSGFR